MALLKILAVLFLIYETHGQVVLEGECQNVTVVKPFKIKDYMGEWHDQEMYYAAFQSGGRCGGAQYTLNDSGVINVVNSQIVKETGKYHSTVGTARPAGDPEEAKLLVKFPTPRGEKEGKYWVLDTDYENYTVVYSCTDKKSDVKQERNVFLWILTRQRQAPREITEKGYAVIDKYELPKKFLIKSDQKDCPAE